MASRGDFAPQEFLMLNDAEQELCLHLLPECRWVGRDDSWPLPHALRRSA
jgi:hypothetical protein